jgi:hypothetical protein
MKIIGRCQYFFLEVGNSFVFELFVRLESRNGKGTMRKQHITRQRAQTIEPIDQHSPVVPVDSRITKN